MAENGLPVYLFQLFGTFFERFPEVDKVLALV